MFAASTSNESEAETLRSGWVQLYFMLEVVISKKISHGESISQRGDKSKDEK